MEKTPKLLLSAVSVILIVIGLSLYGYFQFREYLQGPTIAVDEPQNGSRAPDVLVTVRGRARNAAFFTLNGRQIFTDERGAFKETVLLQDGYNILMLEAKDRFGHVTEKRLELVYKPTERTDDLQPTTDNE